MFSYYSNYKNIYKLMFDPYQLTLTTIFNYFILIYQPWIFQITSGLNLQQLLMGQSNSMQIQSQAQRLQPSDIKPEEASKDKLPWQDVKFERKWEKKSAQNVNSLDYKELRKYIHMPYRKLDHLGINTYYFPVYATFKVKNITQFDFDSLLAKVNGVLILNINVDYRDYFSPTLENSDEERVREALEKLFNFQYLKKQTQSQKQGQGQGKDSKKEQNKHQNEGEKKGKLQKDKSKSIRQLPELNPSIKNKGNIISKVQNQRQQDDKGKKQKDKDMQELNINQKKFLYLRFNRDDPIRLPCKRIFEGQIKQEEKPKKADKKKKNKQKKQQSAKQQFLDQQNQNRQKQKQQKKEEQKPKLKKQKGESKPKQPVQYIRWTIRKQFKIALSPGTIWQDLIAPFNLLKFKLVLCFQDIDMTLSNNEYVKFKFNCMRRVGDQSLQQRKHIFQQLRFTDDGSLGQYDLAQTELDVNCNKYLVNDYQEDIETDYQSFKYITFTIPFYKYPIIDSLTIFIPLVLITVLTLFTFVQGPDFNDKIGNLATLMIVYVGLIPAISDALPSTTNIVLIDIVVYCQLTINILCLIRGHYIMQYTPNDFKNYHVWQDPLFIISFCIAILTGIILLFLLIYFKIKKAYFYNLEQDDIEQIENKLFEWVSPHMYGCARNIKTQITRKQNEKQKQKNRTNMKAVTNLSIDSSKVKVNSSQIKPKVLDQNTLKSLKESDKIK